MSGKSLNARISAYKEAFTSGEIQKTYQSLVGIVLFKASELNFQKNIKMSFQLQTCCMVT